MKLKLACADFTFPLLPHDKVLDLISMLGFEGVDIGLFQDRSHLQPTGMFTDVSKNAHELRGKLGSRGLKPADIFLQTALDFTSVAPNHPDKAVREKSREAFLKAVEFTVECGGKHVSALPGVFFKSESEGDSLKRCHGELAWRCEEAAKSGLVFSVEAHLGSIATTPKAAMALVSNTPGLTLTLDYTHFTKQGVVDAEIEPLIAHASHFHARGAAKDRLQTPVRESAIDYARVVAAMKKTNYQGYVGIEYTWTEWENCDRTDNLSETILLRDLIKKAHGAS